MHKHLYKLVIPFSSVGKRSLLKLGQPYHPWTCHHVCLPATHVTSSFRSMFFRYYTTEINSIYFITIFCAIFFHLRSYLGKDM